MVAAFSLRMKAIWRGARMLRTALGPAIAMWFKVPAVVEVMLHPDGRLQVDRLTEGLADTGDCPPQTAGWGAHSMESADCPTIGHHRHPHRRARLFLSSFAGGVDG